MTTRTNAMVVALAGAISTGVLVEGPLAAAAQGNKTVDTENRRFSRGPAISTASGLRSWLGAQKDAQGKAKRVRVPFTVVLGASGSMVESAWAGSGERRYALESRLDDTALGISLGDRARQMCPTDGRCVLWLEGTWHGTVEGMGQFRVLKVDRAVSRQETGEGLWVEVEEKK